MNFLISTHEGVSYQCTLKHQMFRIRVTLSFKLSKYFKFVTI